MKIQIKKIIFSAITVFVCLFSFVPLVFATTTAGTLTGGVDLGVRPVKDITYTLLEPLPCVSGPGCTGQQKTIPNLAYYINYMFKLAVGIAVVLAVIMVFYGGFTYATTDLIPAKTEGKKIIQNALIGLLLTLASYIILYTIDPRYVEFNTSLDRVKVDTTSAFALIINTQAEANLRKTLTGEYVNRAQIRNELTDVQNQIYDYQERLNDPLISDEEKITLENESIPNAEKSLVEKKAALVKSQSFSEDVMRGLEAAHLAVNKDSTSYDKDVAMEKEKVLVGEKTLLDEKMISSINKKFEDLKIDAIGRSNETELLKIIADEKTVTKNQVQLYGWSSATQYIYEKPDVKNNLSVGGVGATAQYAYGATEKARDIQKLIDKMESQKTLISQETNLSPNSKNEVVTYADTEIAKAKTLLSNLKK
ncbi:MAG: pilin [Candidatus Taylorbacteria bacterium]|nr:pilin [Candidatus Taylorbacteria bacterium]